MTPQLWTQVRQIFEEAVDRAPADREAYLRVVCMGDEELRYEVDSLLASHQDSSGDFLETPAAQLPQTLLFGSGNGPTMGDPGESTMAYNDSDPGDYPEGYRVGPYQLQRCLGRGGMGAVWAANRFDNAFDKVVAVKLVRRGLDSHEILRRFRNERQMLAALDHPNVARLLDGGSTPDGLPFIVMEYVEGTRIDNYCDQNKLSISDRLLLFRDVCAAVQYAHRNLIIHRDIKPGNILVTKQKQVKLLDFGIAKLVRQNLGTAQFPSNRFASIDLQLTQPNQTPMTLDYASPEQVRGDPVSTASDVYALGVLLFKLFTGRSPYAGVGRSALAIQNAICELQPPKPSAVVLTDDRMQVPDATVNLQAVSVSSASVKPVAEESRAKSRRRLRKKLAGDLDAIVLQALRKEPECRYESVEQFSEDIRRYLEGRPVRARSGSIGYRLGKFLRRNKAGVAAGFLIIIALAATSWSTMTVVRSERDRAENKLREARRAAHEVLATGVPATPAVALAKAIYGERPQDAVGRADLAAAEARAGDEAVAKGNRAAALPHYRAALGLLASDSDPLELASVRQRLGNAQLQLGDLLGAMASFSGAAQTASNALAKESSTGKPRAETRMAAARGFERMGLALFRNGAKQEGLATMRKGIGFYLDVAAEQPENAAAQSELALAQAQLGGLLADSEQYAEAISAQRKAVQRLEALAVREPM
ncbi:MAG: serine/threonine-protein kinase, partial [Bryobacteraceae bacterium]